MADAPLHVLIADDEAPARKRMRKMLQPHVEAGRVSIAAEAADGKEALEHLEAGGVELAFLDIRMPELDGFDVLERVSPDRRPVVVFTTAYDSYALKAFEANAIDYLLKPIDKTRLAEAIERARRARPEGPAPPEGPARPAGDDRLERLLDWLETQSADSAPEPAGEPIKQLSIPLRDRILIVPVERLISAEIQDGITRVFVLDDEGPRARVRPHIVSYTLDQLEGRLDADRFVRVHRAALVQLEHITEMVPWFSGRYKLVLTGGHDVIASRDRSRTLKDRLTL